MVFQLSELMTAGRWPARRFAGVSAEVRAWCVGLIFGGRLSHRGYLGEKSKAWPTRPPGGLREYAAEVGGLQAMVRREMASVEFVVLGASYKGIGLWPVRVAGFGMVGLVENILVGGGCKDVEQRLAVRYLIDHGLLEWVMGLWMCCRRLARG